MNLLPWIAAQAVGALLRQCPHCHHRQAIAPELRDQPVPCEKCGRDIPAPPAEDRPR